MLCETYREALTEAVAEAAGSAPLLTHALRRHLEACAACRTFLAEEQQLFAAIDSSLRIAANAEMPPSLVGRVRAGLNEQQVRQHSWFPLAAAFASAALLLTVVLFVRGRGRHNLDLHTPASAVASLAAPTETPDIPTPVVAARAQSVRHPSKYQSSRIAFAGSVPRDEVRVLIPPGHKEAVDALLIALRTGAVNGDILVADKAEKPSQSGELSPLSISPIEIQPLAPVSEESAPDGEKTSR